MPSSYSCGDGAIVLVQQEIEVLSECGALIGHVMIALLLQRTSPQGLLPDPNRNINAKALIRTQTTVGKESKNRQSNKRRKNVQRMYTEVNWKHGSTKARRQTNYAI
jgi:hypothetical protein